MYYIIPNYILNTKIIIYISTYIFDLTIAIDNSFKIVITVNNLIKINNH